MGIRNTSNDTLSLRAPGGPRTRLAANQEHVGYLLPFDAVGPLEVSVALGEWYGAVCADHRPKFVRDELDDQHRVVQLWRCPACKTEEWRRDV